MSKFRFAFILGAAIFVLPGCVGGSSPEENIYKVLEETVAKEKICESSEASSRVRRKRKENLYENHGSWNERV